MSKIRVMAIAPYEGLRELINSISKEYSNQMEVTSEVGDLYEGLKIAQAAEKNGYDIIISRGGTSELIRHEVSIPIINIEVSGYDYIRAIKLAEKIPGPRAVIGFPNIISGARSVNDIVHTDIRMFTVNKQEEIIPLLLELNNKGYGLVIGDVATERRARDLGMNGMLLTSGEESIRAAFSNAIILCREIEKYRDRSSLLQQVMAESSQRMVVYSIEKEQLYINFSLEEYGLTDGDFLRYLDNIIYNKSQDVVIQKEMRTITIKGRLIEAEGKQRGVAFYIYSNNVGIPKNTKGIYYRDTLYVSGRVTDMLQKKGIYDRATMESFASFCCTGLPVLLTGSEGVGKSRMAFDIHKCSANYNKPFVTIYCTVANLEGWEKIIKGSGQCEPLIEGSTICFENIDRMPLSWQDMLATMLDNNEMTDKYRFISTSGKDIACLVKKGGFNRRLYSIISQLMLYLPEIGEYKRDLKNIVNIFIMEANVKFGKQITGIENEAIGLLEGYPWKYNFKELNQVIAQLVITSPGPVITSQDTHLLLAVRSEKIISGQQKSVELDGTLDEIEDRIIKKVLEIEKGSLINTAKRLDIGRSTLWRRLNKQ